MTVVSMDDRVASCECKLKYSFSDKSLLSIALTHTSASSSREMERLEFLGDAVIQLLVTDSLYRKNTSCNEGKLSNLRSLVVSGHALSVAGRILEKYIVVGREISNIPASILENTVEAVIGAVYLDGGLEAAGSVLALLFSQIHREDIQEGVENPKAHLQEWVQKNKGVLPSYKVLSVTGPGHLPCYHIAVFVDDEIWGEGDGTSKKRAEQSAAKEALKRCV